MIGLIYANPTSAGNYTLAWISAGRLVSNALTVNQYSSLIPQRERLYATEKLPKLL